MTQASVHKPLFATKRRTDSSYARHNEDWFAFLDRVDDVCFGRVRDLLNEWFAGTPADKVERLRSRFTSRTPEQVESAFWELTLHAALCKRGFEVAFESRPGSGSTDIDYRISSSRTSAECYFEATVAGDPSSVRARRRRLEAVWDTVNQAAPPGFFAWIARVENEGLSAPSGKRLREAIVPWLQGLDRATVRDGMEREPGRYALPECVFEIADWRFRVRAFPLSDDAAASPDDGARLIGVGPSEVAAGGSRAAIMGALDRKRSAKHGTISLPYVVALLDLHRFAGDDDIVSALFGEPALQLTLRGDEMVSTDSIRHRNGFWQEDRNTRTSAVLYARNLSPWMFTRVTPQLWVNPWATRPLEAELPWASRVAVGENGELVRTAPPISLAQLFGVPEDWPGPEQPFERPA